MEEKTETTKEEKILSELAALFTDETSQEQTEVETEASKSIEEPPAHSNANLEALQAENEQLKKEVAEYKKQAEVLLNARVQGLSEQKKSKMNSLFEVLQANSPLQQLVILNTIQGAATKKVVDNARHSTSSVATKPKNLKELRGNLKKILASANI